MTLTDRSTERRLLVADGTVPGVTSRPAAVAKRIYAEITPNDGTMTTRALVRFRNVAFVLALCALSAVAGAQLADRTAPGVCLDPACQVELTPRRGDRVTVRTSFPGQPPREATVAEACLRPGDLTGFECPGWLIDWRPAG